MIEEQQNNPLHGLKCKPKPAPSTKRVTAVQTLDTAQVAQVKAQPKNLRVDAEQVLAMVHRIAAPSAEANPETIQEMIQK